MTRYRCPLLFEFARDLAQWSKGELLRGVERELAALSERRAVTFANRYRDAFVPLVQSYGGDASLWALEQREHRQQADLNTLDDEQFRHHDRRYWLFRDTRKGAYGGHDALERLGFASATLCDLAPDHAPALRAALTSALNDA